ncbi:MAG: polyprenol monophosphomannose synthase [Phycisphaerae bacterium]|nr:polyprenol monophosphomannose synthase [Phycisphaerae bacterium]
MRDISGLDIDLLIMDDNSRDGSAEFVESLRLPWVQLVTRTTDRGLSPSVVDGLRRARGDVLIVMDADLSHPPEKVPELVRAVATGDADFVIGSRYVAGATTDENRGLFRWLNSKVATLIARPLTTAKDPMAGFFALRRQTLDQAPYLNPVGYKIALEFRVKCNCRKVAEVPIHFADRQFGESKLSFKEQMKTRESLK